MGWAEKLPSGRYRGVYRDVAGKRRSAGVHSHKPKAERAAAAAEDAARKAAWRDPDAGRRTWGSWCDEWWPTRSVEASTLIVDAGRRRVHLNDRWSDVPLGSITRHDVKAWAAQLRSEGVKAAVVQRCVHLLSASLNAAVDAELLALNPAARIRLPSPPPAAERFLTLEEYDAVRAALPDSEAQLIVELLTYTGLRWGELSGLHEDRVDLRRGLLRVVEVFDERSGVMKPYPKGRRARTVPLTKSLVEKLRDRDAEDLGPVPCGIDHVEGRCRSRLLLTTESGTVLRNSNWSPTWRNAVEESGIGACRIHDLRHTYASWLLQGGRSLAEVGQLLGHVSPVTTQRYAHLEGHPHAGVLAVLEGGDFEPAAPRLPHGNGAAESA